MSSRHSSSIPGSSPFDSTARRLPIGIPSFSTYQNRAMERFWLSCLSRLENELPAQQFNTWIKPLRLDSKTPSDRNPKLLYISKQGHGKILAFLPEPLRK